MAKKIKTIIKLQCPAGRANPAPPVGPVLGQHGLNIMDFCNRFNEATKTMGNTTIPAEITVYEDRTFDFILKQPPAAILLKEAAKIEKGAANPLKDKVGTVTKAQLHEIAERKMVDLNVNTVEQAEKTIAGTARSMGIKIT
ncbi:MAG: 50S ribosomal protein L11 [uncultured bacterium]|nr:MAG: 50S ribosomal protein L11 [uncultured bacterium]